jgi:hypothetical protein
MRAQAWVGMVLLVAYVPVSSLLGLMKPMGDIGGQVFGDVWEANLWGDLTFTFGSMGTALLVALYVRLAWQTADARRVLVVLAVPLAFGATWLVYFLSWSMSGPAGDGQFFHWAAQFEADVWEVVWDWGKAGIWAGAFLVPLIAWLYVFIPEAMRQQGPQTMPRGRTQ